jgi:hypothetical protein
MEVLDESHNMDITSVNFHPFDNQRVVSCGMDCLLNVFGFEGKKSLKEDDDVIETIYSSE